MGYFWLCLCTFCSAERTQTKPNIAHFGPFDCQLFPTTQFHPQVFKTSDGDKSVPITWAYNHHYGAYLSGGYSKMTQLDVESGGAYPFGHQNHGAPALWLVLPDEDVDDPRPTSNVPISQFFSEGNGGEFRSKFAH